MTNPSSPWKAEPQTAVLVLADGSIIKGKGLGTVGATEGEICFNTALTGYEEILTDPSYAGQIVTFTFPHIGNVGTNLEDIEDLQPEKNFGAVGAIFRADITSPSNYRAREHLEEWLKKRGVIAITGIDTRALTSLLREKGALKAVIAYHPEGKFDLEALHKRAQEWPGLENLDLAQNATSSKISQWAEKPWVWKENPTKEIEQDAPLFHIVAVDFGIKRNILRLLSQMGAKITVVPAKTSAEDILALQPDGVFLSNGPGDPAATAQYATPMIQKILEKKIPLFGICLGHQLLALAMGAKTTKMHQGHHGANHPVKNLSNNKVEIVSMNHGFAVDTNSFPSNVKETHLSLFDKTNCGLMLTDKPAFSVQYHPEASPGPHDSHYLFEQFKKMVLEYKKQKEGQVH